MHVCRYVQHILGVIRNKCAGRNNFHISHFENFHYFSTLLDLAPAHSDRLFAAVHLQSNGSSGLTFGDGSDNPITAHLEALQGQ